MANFSQKKAVRESTAAGSIDSMSNVEPGEENLDVQLADLANTDSELDQLEKDGETLTEDTERSEAALADADEAIANGEEQSEEAIAHAEVAQESIRKRWNIEVRKVSRESFRRSRGMTKASREGIKETIIGLWERFLELIQAGINKIKDLKLKYLNVGKTAQNRAAKYQELIRKLSKKTKDEIGGGWITKLSIEGKFAPDESLALAKDVTGGKAKGAITAMSSQAGNVSAMVAKTAEGETEAFNFGESKVELFGTAAKKLKNLPEFENGESQQLMALPGNAYVQSGTKTIAGHAFSAVAFMSTGDASEDKNVPTPDVSKLTQLAGGLKLVGSQFEKVLQDFRAYDAEIGKLQEAAKKAKAAVQSAGENELHQKELSAARSAADQAVKNYQTLNRTVSYVANTVISGLNGYIGAGIGAYGKAA